MYVLQWQRRLESGVASPDGFREAVSQLRAAVDGIERAAFLELVEVREVSGDLLVRDGRLCRFKQDVDKKWMTLWGEVTVWRRQYQPDRGGASVTPLDERCGMIDRYMVPELERVTALLASRLVPSEVEDSLSEVLRERPSRTAIQHVLRKVGKCAEEHAEELEQAIEDGARSTSMATRWPSVGMA